MKMERRHQGKSSQSPLHFDEGQRDRLEATAMALHQRHCLLLLGEAHCMMDEVSHHDI